MVKAAESISTITYYIPYATALKPLTVKLACSFQNVFKIYDKDKSGHLNSFELRRALTSAGYNVNNKVLQALSLRYGDKEGQIWFDDFIMCTVKLKAMIGE